MYNNMNGQKQDLYITTNEGYIPVNQIGKNFEEAGKLGTPNYIDNKTEFYNSQAKVKIGEGYKDLHKVTYAFFKSKGKLFNIIPNEGLFFTLFYVLSMVVLGFHLWHGFQSAFQSLGVNGKFTPAIKVFGKAFSVIVPILFAIIPIYIHFFSK